LLLPPSSGKPACHDHTGSERAAQPQRAGQQLAKRETMKKSDLACRDVVDAPLYRLHARLHRLEASREDFQATFELGAARELALVEFRSISRAHISVKIADLQIIALVLLFLVECANPCLDSV
jgi:hypothetical protein